MHRLVVAHLKNDDKIRLSAERMRITAVKSKKIKLGIRTRSVGAGPENDENTFRRQGLGYDPVVKDGKDTSRRRSKWTHITEGNLHPGQLLSSLYISSKKVHNATLYGGKVAIGFNCKLCGYLTGHRWREPARYSFSLKGVN